MLWTVCVYARGKEDELADGFLGVEQLAGEQRVAARGIGAGVLLCEAGDEGVDVRGWIGEFRRDFCERRETCCCGRCGKGTGFVLQVGF